MKNLLRHRAQPQGCDRRSRSGSKLLLFPLFFLLSPLFLSAQTESADKGIKWTTGLTWEQVKEKAKKENKYIFLDCYTTWCGPCKMMDKNVYPNDTLTVFFNKNFISVRVQFDRTKDDNEEIKSWYNTVRDLNERYMIDAYPSYLFFAPDGKATVKEKGYKDVLSFLKMANWASVTQERIEDVFDRYTRQLAEFKSGKIVQENIPFLVGMARKKGDGEMVRQMITAHENYMLQLSKKKRYTKEHIEFWSSCNLGPERKLVRFYIKDAKEIDKAIGKKGYANNQLDKWIKMFVVDPFINEQLKDPALRTNLASIDPITGSIIKGGNTDEADWNKLSEQIKEKYGKAYMARNLLKAKADWYMQNGNWTKAATVSFELFDKYAPDVTDVAQAININELSWRIFLSLNDPILINKAAYWMGKVTEIFNNEAYMADTYANILYKAGRKEEAIKWQEIAVRLRPDKNIQIIALAQMKNGNPSYVGGANWEGINTVSWEGVRFDKGIRVTDVNNKPVDGVSITNKRSKESKIIAKGKSSAAINVAYGDTLFIAAAGYQSQEFVITKNNAKPAQVILKPAADVKNF